jgi:hypothetical protein
VADYYAWRKTKQYPNARLLFIHPLSEAQIAGKFDQELSGRDHCVGSGSEKQFSIWLRVNSQSSNKSSGISSVRDCFIRACNEIPRGSPTFILVWAIGSVTPEEFEHSYKFSASSRISIFVNLLF